MVRTHVLTGYEEHFLAYLVAGAIIAAAPRGSPPLGTGILLWLYAGVLELGQNFVPGRHPAIEDFAASALGALVGIVLTTVLRARVSRLPSLKPTQRYLEPSSDAKRRWSTLSE